LTNNIETDQTHEEEDLKLVDKGTKKKLKQDLEARNQFENDNKTSLPPAAEEEDLMLKDSKDSNKASSSKANSRSHQEQPDHHIQRPLFLGAGQVSKIALEKSPNQRIKKSPQRLENRDHR